MDGHNGGGGVKILVFQFAQGAAVHGIGVVRAKGFEVEPVRAPADFLVGGEADAQCRVGHGFPHQLLGGG